MMVLPLLVTTCATTGQNPKPSSYCPKPNPHAVCVGWQPIYLHADDYAKVDPRTVLEIDEHNKYGVKMGCWDG